MLRVQINAQYNKIWLFNMSYNHSKWDSWADTLSFMFILMTVPDNEHVKWSFVITRGFKTFQKILLKNLI